MALARPQEEGLEERRILTEEMELRQAARVAQSEKIQERWLWRPALWHSA